MSEDYTQTEIVISMTRLEIEHGRRLMVPLTRLQRRIGIPPDWLVKFWLAPMVERGTLTRDGEAFALADGATLFPGDATPLS